MRERWIGRGAGAGGGGGGGGGGNAAHAFEPEGILNPGHDY